MVQIPKNCIFTNSTS